MINSFHRGRELLFLDECVFTSRSLLTRVWRRRNADSIFPKTSLTFGAVAVIAVINIEGELIAYEMAEGSIKIDHMLLLLR